MLRASIGVAIGTLLSRITGLIRLALLASLIGPGLLDAYTNANNIPNVLYELVLGGVLTATLVPLFTEHVATGDHDATSAVFSVALVATAVVTIVLTAGSFVVARIYSVTTPIDVDPAQFRRVLLGFVVLFLPQIFFYAVTALASAILNARNRFFAAAWAPVINNLVVIVALAFVGRVAPGRAADRDLSTAQHGSLGWLLGLSTTAGIVAAAVVLLPVLRAAGVRLRFRPDRRHPAVRKVLALSGWTLGYVAANQIALYVMTQLAQRQNGGWPAYLLAFTLFQLPVGLLAVSVMTTFMPELARARIEQDRARFLDRVSLGIRSIALVTLPAAAGLIALARPLVSVVLEHGAYDARRSSVTASSLAAFAVGLFALSAYLFILRAFYAHNDTRTACLVNLVENVINIVVALALVGRFGVAGLAWSFTIAYSLSALLALRVLTYKVPGMAVRPLLAGVLRLAVAATATAAVAWIASRLVGADRGNGALLRVVVGSVAGIAVYGAVLAALRVPELAVITGRFSRATAPGGPDLSDQ